MPAAPSTDATVRPGRPRRYAAAEELQLLLDAGFTVIGQKGYGAATVADILAEAGMSTRSFYRHFASKDDLLNALFRRDADQFAAAVTRRVEAAPDPSSALGVWIDEILGFGLGRPRAKRAAVLGTDAAIRTLAPEEIQDALDLLMAPLMHVLTAGAADGTFTSEHPDTDTSMVSALAWDMSMRMIDAPNRAAKEGMRAGVHSFVRRALGSAGSLPE